MSLQYKFKYKNSPVKSWHQYIFIQIIQKSYYINSIELRKNCPMRDSLGWKCTNQKLHTHDAFIRIGILQTKILRKQKTMSQMMSEIHKISSWNIQKNKNKLFAKRIRTFAKNVGSNQLLAVCLSKFVQLLPSIPAQPRVSILYLISKCHTFFQEAQVLTYLTEAVVLMGKDIQNFQQYGVHCCLQFCKLTQIQSQFHIVFQRCTQCLLARLSNTRLSSTIQEIGLKQNGRRQQFRQIQKADYKNYKNIKLKRQQRVCVQQLLQLFLIGSIKCSSSKQRQQYQNKLQNWVNEFYHCDHQLFSVPVNEVVKQYKRSLNQGQLSGIRIRKLNQFQKLYHINLPKQIYIPSIVFENKIKHQKTQRRFVQQQQYEQRKPISDIRNTEIEMQKLKIKTVDVIKNKKRQLQIQNKVYSINYQKENKLAQSIIYNKVAQSRLNIKIHQKDTQQKQQYKQDQIRQGRLQQIVEQCQKNSRKTSQFYSKNGQFGTTCDSAQFNQFQWDDLPQFIIKAESQNQQDHDKQQQPKQQHIKWLSPNTQIQDIDKILSDCNCSADFDNEKINTQQQFSQTDFCQSSHFGIKQTIQQVQNCQNKFDQDLSQNIQQNKMLKQEQNALILQLILYQLQEQFQQILIKQNSPKNYCLMGKNDIRKLPNQFQVCQQNLLQKQKSLLQSINSYNYIIQVPKSQQQLIQSISNQDYFIKNQKGSQSYQISNQTLSLIENNQLQQNDKKERKRQKYIINLFGLHKIQLKHVSAKCQKDKIYYLLRQQNNRQKTQIVGYLSQAQQFRLQNSKLILIFPFNVLQSRSNVEQKIQNIDNYIIFSKDTNKTVEKCSQQQQSSNKLGQNRRKRVIVYGLWIKMIQSKLKLYIEGDVLTLNYTLYEIFYEDATFDAIICISQLFSNRDFQINQKDQDNKREQKGRIRLHKINTDLWFEVQNSIQTIIGYCIHGEGKNYTIRHQLLNQQYIKNIIL